MAMPARANRGAPPRQRPGLALVKREPKVTPASDDAAKRFAVCRTLGHTWQHVGFAQPTDRVPIGQYNAVGYVSRCSHCGTTRTKWMSRYGNRGTVTYRYEDGYERRGEERLSLQEWRRTWLVGVLGDDA